MAEFENEDEHYFEGETEFGDGENSSKRIKRDHYQSDDNSFKWNKKKGTSFHHNTFTEIAKPGKPRKHTLSMAVPASILDATSIKDELRTYVVGQIARAAVIYSVDEIVVYDDGCNDGGEDGNQNNQAAMEKMRTLLEYQELPQYLRKYFFSFDKNLRFVGVLNPLNSSHHLKSDEWCEYREGVVLEGEGGVSKQIDAGLSKNVEIDKELATGLRVTLKFSQMCPDSVTNPRNSYHAKVVSPDEPRKKGGYYWGYSVREASTLSEVVSGCTFPKGYDLIIGTSDKGEDASKVDFPKFKHALIVFGGVEGLEVAIESDTQLKGTKPADLFHFYLNTCLLQQVRTIRTEEAVLITMCAIHEKLTSR